MDKQIKKLVELANKYKEFGTENNFPMGNTDLRKASYNYLNDTDLVRIYFNDNYCICIVYFGPCVISFYGRHEISFPFNITAKKLDLLYCDCELFLQTYANENLKILQKELKIKRLSRIKELKSELSLLKLPK